MVSLLASSFRLKFEGISEVLDRFDKVDFTCEYKYDGERAQVHLTEDGTVKIFSRSSLDDTHKFTEVVDSFRSCVAEGVTSCIIDSECVAYDLGAKMMNYALKTRYCVSKKHKNEKSCIKKPQKRGTLY